MSMKIELRPEVEAIIQRNVERGPYKSAEEFLEEAVSILHGQETWLAEQGSEIRAKIEAGYAAAKRGDLMDSGEARTRMEEKKRNWLADRR